MHLNEMAGAGGPSPTRPRKPDRESKPGKRGK